MKRLYYSIRDISEALQEEQYILRYWEKEFPQLKPKKNSAGNRIYSQKDFDLLVEIKRLIREEKLQIAEAKAILDGLGARKAEGKAKSEIIVAKEEKVEPEPRKEANIEQETARANDIEPVQPEKIGAIEEKTEVGDVNSQDLAPKKEANPKSELALKDDELVFEVKKDENFNLFSDMEIDPKITLRKSDLMKLYSALKECVEELKRE